MRVFVTGASGFIGSAVVAELVGAGHQVLGLVRSDAAAKALAATGAEVHRGSLEDLDSLKRGAAASDGVIHTAFVHDFANFLASCKTDQVAIETLGATLAGTGKPLLVSAGVLGLPPGRAGLESDPPHTGFPRKSEETALQQEAKGVKPMVIRLAPTVHGDGDHGFMDVLIRGARERGFSTYVGEGKNRWPAVHRLDAAKLYRLALEKGAAGARYHATAEEGVAIREVAELIGRKLKVPAVSKTPEEAAALFGFVGQVLAADAPVSSAWTQAQLGWKPTHAALLADLENGRYFDLK